MINILFLLLTCCSAECLILKLYAVCLILKLVFKNRRVLDLYIIMFLDKQRPQCFLWRSLYIWCKKGTENWIWEHASLLCLILKLLVWGWLCSQSPYSPDVSHMFRLVNKLSGRSFIHSVLAWGFYTVFKLYDTNWVSHMVSNKGQF